MTMVTANPRTRGVPDNHLHFSKERLGGLPRPATGSSAEYFDTKVEGLTVRVMTKSLTFRFYRWSPTLGRPVRVKIGRFPHLSVEQARSKARELNAEVALGRDPTDEVRRLRAEPCLRDVFEEYLEQRRTKRGSFLSEETKAGYRKWFRLHLFAWGSRRLSQISHEQLVELHNRIGRTTPHAANRTLALLQGIYTYAKVHPNPAHGIVKFHENARERFLRADELPAFFEALALEPHRDIRDFFVLALLTGVRKSDLLTMRWEDVALQRAEWVIPQTKNGEAHTVALPKEAVEILRERAPSPTGWVFPGTGRSGHFVEPKRAWSRVLTRAGLKNVRIHDLRRTLGSWQARYGASLVIIGKSLGHKCPATTAIYARLDLEPIRESMQRAANAMIAAGQARNEEMA